MKASHVKTGLVVPAIAAAVLFAACTDVTSLQQSNPSQLSTATVFTPENAQLIVNSSQGDFECAYNEYIVGSGLFSDELANAISQTANFDYDRRTITPSSPYGTGTCTSQQQPGVYTPLSAARASNDTAVSHLEGWTDAQVPNRVKLIGVASAYAGYSLVLLGEGMCTAAINLGPELTDAQILAQAKIRFRFGRIGGDEGGRYADIESGLARPRPYAARPRQLRRRRCGRRTDPERVSRHDRP